MFFHEDDPLTVALVCNLKYVPVLLDLGLFHAYREYVSVLGRHYVMFEEDIEVDLTPIMEAQRSILNSKST